MDNYEDFIMNNSMCDFEQSLKWNNIKNNWKNEQVIIRQNNEIKLTANVLIRKLPIFGVMMYVPRGPIGEIHNIKLMEELTNELKKLAKKYKAFIVLMEPDIRYDNEEFKSIAEYLGYKINSKSKTFISSIQARYNLRLDIKNKSEEELLKSFNQKARYNIKLAQKKGVVVKDVGIKGLDDFYELLKTTGQRDKFIIRPKDYYANIMHEFKDTTILLAYYEDEPIAGIMVLSYGNKTWYLNGASGNNHRNTMPNYLLQWEAIKIAMNNNSILYDFKGCSFKRNKPDGLYRFKKSFGTELVELIGEVNIEIKPSRYHLFRMSKILYCNIRKIKHHIINYLRANN